MENARYRISTRGKVSVTKQLYQLQEIDLQIETNEQSLRQKTSQLGESQAVIAAQGKLASEQ